MRDIYDHKVFLTEPAVEVVVLDEPGHGGAHHHYAVSSPEFFLDISFQNGTIPEAGVNGVTHEALLAIVMDRLRCFQKGPFACKENACALTHIEEALHWLQQRTIARGKRGVEGKHIV